MIREHGTIEKIVQSNPELHKPEHLDRIRQIFLKPEVTSNYALKWREPDLDRLVGFLCGERDFSEDRVRTAVAKAKVGFAEESGKKTLERSEERRVGKEGRER